MFREENDVIWKRFSSKKSVLQIFFFASSLRSLITFSFQILDKKNFPKIFFNSELVGVLQGRIYTT